MAGKMVQWSTQQEEKLELWQQHESLFNIFPDMYYAREEKSKWWDEIADVVQLTSELKHFQTCS